MKEILNPEIAEIARELQDNPELLELMKICRSFPEGEQKETAVRQAAAPLKGGLHNEGGDRESVIDAFYAMFEMTTYRHVRELFLLAYKLGRESLNPSQG